MNVELDGIVGLIFKVYVDKVGVVFINVDGDQFGVIMNLYRFVKGIGIKFVLCGNIKGLYDFYCNLIIQEGFVKKWGQNFVMVILFVDGIKILYEQVIVVNVIGMWVVKCGMFGLMVVVGIFIIEVVNWYLFEELL